MFSNPASYESLRNTSVKLRYTFLEMPQDNGFEIRFEDPRIGYFTDRVTDLSSIEITPYRDLVQKWNLQNKILMLLNQSQSNQSILVREYYS